MKYEVKHMNGDRVAGYIYIGVEGTDLVLCRDGHPEFPKFFSETTTDDNSGETEAKRIVRKLNRQKKSI